MKPKETDNLNKTSTITETINKDDKNKSFEELIIDNEKFVYSIVNKEFKKYSWNIKEDLYSAGKAGLVYAATKFDSNKFNNKFISYAVHWIRYYVNEEIRNMHPVKLNQNYMYKRKCIKNCISTFQKKYKKDPTISELSNILNMSEKVIKNTLNINNGENFQFINFQNSNEAATENENKLINEYLEEEASNYYIDKFELNDLLEALKKQIDIKDYNMFVDKYINNLSYSDLAKKYKLNFPSSAKYIIERTEKICKKLLN